MRHLRRLIRMHSRWPVVRAACERSHSLRRLDWPFAHQRSFFVAAAAVVWWLPIPEVTKPTAALDATGLPRSRNCRARVAGSARSIAGHARENGSVAAARNGGLGRSALLPTSRYRLACNSCRVHAQFAIGVIFVSGASTITQQLVKLATGREQRSWSENSTRRSSRGSSNTGGARNEFSPNI